MDEVKAIEALTQEMALTRSEMAALTDSMAANRHVMETLARETRRLADLMRAALERRRWWQRLAG